MVHISSFRRTILCSTALHCSTPFVEYTRPFPYRQILWNTYKRLFQASLVLKFEQRGARDAAATVGRTSNFFRVWNQNCHVFSIRKWIAYLPKVLKVCFKFGISVLFFSKWPAIFVSTLLCCWRLVREFCVLFAILFLHYEWVLFAVCLCDVVEWLLRRVQVARNFGSGKMELFYKVLYPLLLFVNAAMGNWW